MKANFDALHQHYEIRESRYRDRIEAMQQAIDERDAKIQELTENTQVLNATVRRLSEQLERIVKYNDSIPEELVKPKRKFPFFWKKQK